MENGNLKTKLSKRNHAALTIFHSLFQTGLTKCQKAGCMTCHGIPEVLPNICKSIVKMLWINRVIQDNGVAYCSRVHENVEAKSFKPVGITFPDRNLCEHDRLCYCQNPSSALSEILKQVKEALTSPAEGPLHDRLGDLVVICDLQRGCQEGGVAHPMVAERATCIIDSPPQITHSTGRLNGYPPCNRYAFPMSSLVKCRGNTTCALSVDVHWNLTVNSSCLVCHILLY